MIAVVADSAANLPPEVAEEHGVSIVPMVVHLGGRTFRDGLDLAPGELYARLAAGEGPATTATPSPAAFLAAYRASGAAEIVCVTVASSMSAAHQQAVAAASEFEGSVEVVDSRSASMAEGFVALEAARAAARGASLREVAAAARTAASETRLFATVDTFDHLQRSGRVSRLQAYAATALDIKPVFAFRDGEPSAVARPRARRRALDRVVAETVAAAAGRTIRLAAIHAVAEDDARRVAERVRAEVEVAELFVVEVTPVVGVHVGPGLVGTAFQPVRD
jgi:DegV family protein with EDD domain